MGKHEQSKIPDHLLAGLDRWIQYGRMPGEFLQAVILNDLHGAMSRGSARSRACLFDLVLVLYNDAPAQCWRTVERVEAWKGHAGWQPMSIEEQTNQEARNAEA